MISQASDLSVSEWGGAYLFDEMFDRSQTSTYTPHVVQANHLPLHGQQHCSAV